MHDVHESGQQVHVFEEKVEMGEDELWTPGEGGMEERGRDGGERGRKMRDSKSLCYTRVHIPSQQNLEDCLVFINEC